MSSFQVFVSNHRNSVCNWSIAGIENVQLENPSAEHPKLYKLTVTTKAPTSHDIYFNKQDVAEKAYYDIKTAQQTREDVILQVQEEFNKHLLHPDQF